MKWGRRRSKGPTEAQKAVKASEQALAEAQAQTPGIRALAADLRRIREANHFAERITEALRGEAS